MIGLVANLQLIVFGHNLLVFVIWDCAVLDQIIQNCTVPRSDHLELYSSKIRSDHYLLRTNSVRSDQCLAETNSFRSNDLELYSFRSDHCLVGTNRAEKAYIEALSLNTPKNTLISNLHQQHLLWQHRLYFCYIHCIGDFTAAGHNIIDLLSSEHLLVRELQDLDLQIRSKVLFSSHPQQSTQATLGLHKQAYLITAQSSDYIILVHPLTSSIDYVINTS